MAYLRVKASDRTMTHGVDSMLITQYSGAMREPRVAIAGAGIAGAYLSRRLRQQRCGVHIYDPGHRTKCGVGPCGWATSQEFAGFVEQVGLDPDKYVLRRFDHVWMDDMRIPADLITIDKPALVQDFLHGTELRTSGLDPMHYDRVIDATGSARAFLAALERDVVASCMQYRVRVQEARRNSVRLWRIGYAWCFPLSETEYHIGCGSYSDNPRRVLEELQWLVPESSTLSGTVCCSCSGNIRLNSPLYSQPFVTDGPQEGVWGVGEAIGCVGPLAGDGIVSAMKSAELLVAHWDDPGGYTRSILTEYSWMADERRVLDKLMAGVRLSVTDALVLEKNLERMAMKITIGQASVVLRRMRHRSKRDQRSRSAENRSSRGTTSADSSEGDG